MTIKKDSAIRIACPAGTERKYPAFYEAFEGRSGRVLHGFAKHPDLFCVDVSRKGESGQFINVERQWLAAVKG